MFEQRGDRLDGVFRRLMSRRILTQPVLRKALLEIRKALLEADVYFRVTKNFFKAMRKMMKQMVRLAPRLAGGGGLGSMLR